MSNGVIETIKDLVPSGTTSESVDFRTYECEECGETIESAKEPDRVQCMECLSRDVTPIEER